MEAPSVNSLQNQRKSSLLPSNPLRLRRKRDRHVGFVRNDITIDSSTTGAVNTSSNATSDDNMSDALLSITVHEFYNQEFISHDAKVRKAVWYTGLEIRAINQANLDIIRQQQEIDQQQSQNNSSDKNKNKNNNNNNDTVELCCCRGLEPLLEGETERKQRIQSFVASLLEVQSTKKNKGSKPEGITESLSAFSRQHSRKDCREAQKMAKLDYLAAYDSSDDSLIDHYKQSLMSSMRQSMSNKDALRRKTEPLSTLPILSTTVTHGNANTTATATATTKNEKKLSLVNRFTKKAHRLSQPIRRMGGSLFKEPSSQSTASTAVVGDDTISRNSKLE